MCSASRRSRRQTRRMVCSHVSALLKVSSRIAYFMAVSEISSGRPTAASTSASSTTQCVSSTFGSYSLVGTPKLPRRSLRSDADRVESRARGPGVALPATLEGRAVADVGNPLGTDMPEPTKGTTCCLSTAAEVRVPRSRFRCSARISSLLCCCSASRLRLSHRSNSARRRFWIIAQNLDGRNSVLPMKTPPSTSVPSRSRN